MTLYVNADNLFDKWYIERGKDGATHDIDTFKGYWGLGRRFTFGMRLDF